MLHGSVNNNKLRRLPQATLNRVLVSFCMSVSHCPAEWSLSFRLLVLTLQRIRVRLPFCVSPFCPLPQCMWGYVCVCVCLCRCILCKCAPVIMFHSVCASQCLFPDMCAIILTVKAIAPHLLPQREY